MANKYLAREDAPFGPEIWDQLDSVMVSAAKQELAGRRLLDVQGPHGIGLKAVPLNDVTSDAGYTTSQLLPVHLVERTFVLAKRDLAAYETKPISIDLGPVARTARAVARIEDELVFKGAAGASGLLTIDGRRTAQLSAWDEPGQAALDIIGAITTLDEGGFHGPYALALSPARYNQLFRLYPRGNRSEMEHVKSMITGGVHKAPILDSGGLLIASGPMYASIILGQDMSIGFVGPVSGGLEFTVSESLALRILTPGALCVLSE